MSTGVSAVIAHVPIGLYDLPIPLTTVLLAAVVVVAASFALIYVRAPSAAGSGARARTVPPALVGALTLAAFVYLGFVIGVGSYGRQQLAALNAASLLFWVWTIPFLPLVHCLVGGMYQVANPFAFVARRLGNGRRLVEADRILDRLGYWPAVVLLFLLVFGESVSEIVQSPAVLGMAAMAYAALQISMGILLGERWYQGGDVFSAMTGLASTIAPCAMRRQPGGSVVLETGFNPARFLPTAPGREALVTLWLAGVLADGVRATPIWRTLILPHTQSFFEQMGMFAGVDLGSATEITLQILVTWLAFGLFFWVFVAVATWLSATTAERDAVMTPARLRAVAHIVSPSLIPIALAYLLAHNLTQILAVGPLIVTARDATAQQVGPLTLELINRLSPEWVWWTQVAAIVAGHVLAVVMAHARLTQAYPRAAASPRTVAAGGPPDAVTAPVPSRAGSAMATRFATDLAFRADLGWLSAMLIYTATSLWILAQPITAAGR